MLWRWGTNQTNNSHQSLIFQFPSTAKTVPCFISSHRNGRTERKRKNIDKKIRNLQFKWFHSVRFCIFYKVHANQLTNNQYSFGWINSYFILKNCHLKILLMKHNFFLNFFVDDTGFGFVFSSCFFLFLLFNFWFKYFFSPLLNETFVCIYFYHYLFPFLRVL